MKAAVKRNNGLCAALMFLCIEVVVADDLILPGPDSLGALAQGQADYRFTTVRFNPPSEGIRREVLQFEVDGLQQYALVLWPAGQMPASGWPVMQFNHGYHPDPPQYGFDASGDINRPGDYYRDVAQRFARQGMAVVVPDYRGHNSSQGVDYTQTMLADIWYSRDAVAAFLAIASLPNVDTSRMYMLGHSMGGGITLRAALALGERLDAAAIWSTSAGRYLPWLLDESLTEGEMQDDSSVQKPALDALATTLVEAGGIDSLSPLTGISRLQVPLSIAHAADDEVTRVENSLEIAARLYLSAKHYQLRIYASDDHLFEGSDLDAAVARDMAWFNQHR
tara:strand:+ start:85705 stop:86712 length:1008 start_codon:yes stop_codon:yes gene_type:complete